MCGEKRKTGAVPAPLPGSPPRMRGKARSHAQLYYDAGKSCTSFQLMFFIWDHPAYAGKRPVLFSDSWIHRDHPRVCGEKFKPFCLRQLCQGSPPRVRGKGRALEGACIPVRITPACAGKRTSTHGMDVRSGDHPRVCGEKHRFKPCNLHQRGSPPRMRGKD